MEQQELYAVLAKLEQPFTQAAITPFCRDEDGSEYNAWKIELSEKTGVLKKTSPEEKTIYETFFPHGGCGAPKTRGFAQLNGDTYMLMEFFEGETLSRCTREKLILLLNVLIEMQDRYWENRELADIGWTFDKKHASMEKRRPYLKDFANTFEEYLKEESTVPRTLCNDDLLPFNALVSNDTAVIIDWEYAGILPYPCALARLLAFGEQDTDFMFQMSLADKQFAVHYYYDNLIECKGITWNDYIRTMKLFFFKEYSEWVYTAESSNNLELPEYKKYYRLSKLLAEDLGYCEESK